MSVYSNIRDDIWKKDEKIPNSEYGTHQYYIYTQTHTHTHIDWILIKTATTIITTATATTTLRIVFFLEHPNNIFLFYFSILFRFQFGKKELFFFTSKHGDTDDDDSNNNNNNNNNDTMMSFNIFFICPVFVWTIYTRQQIQIEEEESRNKEKKLHATPSLLCSFDDRKKIWRKRENHDN